MNEDNLVGEAQSFAAEIHSGQIRPNNGIKLYDHLKEVAELVRKSGGNEMEIIGAWLHDSVEDTPTGIAEIMKRFGNKVGIIVDDMTDPPEFKGLPTLERKTKQAERLISKNASVRRVKLADQISNIRSIKVDPSTGWNKKKCIDYIEGARRIAQQCRGISEFLDLEFGTAYQKAIQIIRAYSDESMITR